MPKLQQDISSERAVSNSKKIVSNTFKTQMKNTKLSDSFYNAYQGFIYALKNERNLKIDICFAIVVCIFGLICQIDATSWIALVICICMVISFEVLNTAIESTIDLISPNYSNLAKVAKDCAAACPLVAACASVVVGIIIFSPYVLSFLGLN